MSSNKKFKRYQEPQQASSSKTPAANLIDEPKLVAIVNNKKRDLQASSASTESVIELNKRNPSDNLRVTDENFKLVQGFIGRIRAKVVLRDHHKRLHDSIALRLNDNTCCSTVRLPEIPPKQPDGITWESSFIAQYQTEAKDLARNLCILLAGEHRSQITNLQAVIKELITESEEALCLIIDEPERLNLFKGLSAAYVLRWCFVTITSSYYMIVLLSD